MTSLPLVSIYDHSTGKQVDKKKLVLPTVFSAPIRPDIVEFVHTNLNKNRRQAHGVDPKAGHKHSAESWGTGRAVARIPRVSGSGTHRSGQAAFGNMCRKGRMFAPLKVWRRWNRRVNVNQKRHAVASALAASALAPLVMARGHKIQNIPQLPLVINDQLEGIEKTKQAVTFLKTVGALEDVRKVVDAKSLRSGKGKLRNRRYRLKRGPLFVYGNEGVTLKRAVRNLPGVDICHVSRLNLLQLAPGGQVGRFIIWTASAFEQLNSIFGTYRYAGEQKDGYNLQRHLLTNADLSRIINSNEVQEALRAKRVSRSQHDVQRKNLLTNKAALDKINPFAKIKRERERKQSEERRKARQAQLKEKRKTTAEEKKARKQRRSASRGWYNNLKKTIQAANDAGLEEELAFKRSGDVREDDV